MFDDFSRSHNCSGGILPLALHPSFLRLCVHSQVLTVLTSWRKLVMPCEGLSCIHKKCVLGVFWRMRLISRRHVLFCCVWHGPCSRRTCFGPGAQRV